MGGVFAGSSVLADDHGGAVHHGTGAGERGGAGLPLGGISAGRRGVPADGQPPGAAGTAVDGGKSGAILAFSHRARQKSGRRDKKIFEKPKKRLP